jgi:hypothetical protein
MRICLKCGDYFADDSLAFCLVDGTPLVRVAPGSDKWREGSRVIEQKENARKKRKRRLEWKRFLQTLITILILGLVLYAMAARRWVYFKPIDSPILSDSPTPPPSPSSSPSPSPSVTPSPTPTPTPSPTHTPTPTPSPSPKVSPSPSPRVSPSPSPRVSPSPTPKISPSPSPSPSVSPPVECSDQVREREKPLIKKEISRILRDILNSEKKQVIAQVAAERGNRSRPDDQNPSRPDGQDRSRPYGQDPGKPEGGKPRDLKKIFGAALGNVFFAKVENPGDPNPVFEGCTFASVSYKYVWLVWQADSQTVINRVRKEKTFRCTKERDRWSCRHYP